MKKPVPYERNGQYAVSMQKRANIFITFAMLAIVIAIIYNLAKTSIADNEKYQELANSSRERCFLETRSHLSPSYKQLRRSELNRTS